MFILEYPLLKYKNDFSDQVNFVDYGKNYTLSATLVDHHILNKNDKILHQYITQIFDHRPLDNSQSWDVNKVKMRIEQVGSCCTLVADEILTTDPDILTLPLSFLLYRE